MPQIAQQDYIYIDFGLNISSDSYDTIVEEFPEKINQIIRCIANGSINDVILVFGNKSEFVKILSYSKSTLNKYYIDFYSSEGGEMKEWEMTIQELNEPTEEPS